MAQVKPVIEWWWDYLDPSQVVKQDYFGKQGASGTKNVWDMGIVRAGNEATVDETVKTIYLWNNKGGVAQAQNMTNVEITIRDGNTTDGQFHEGNADSPLVTQRWVECKTFKSVKGSTETGSAWTPIGLAEDKTIAKVALEALGNATLASVDSFNKNEISGAINGGTFTAEADKNNYAKLQLRMKVPAEAEAGEVSYIARVYYSARVI